MTLHNDCGVVLMKVNVTGERKRVCGADNVSDT